MSSPSGSPSDSVPVYSRLGFPLSFDEVPTLCGESPAGVLPRTIAFPRLTLLAQVVGTALAPPGIAKGGSKDIVGGQEAPFHRSRHLRSPDPPPVTHRHLDDSIPSPRRLGNHLDRPPECPLLHPKLDERLTVDG